MVRPIPRRLATGAVVLGLATAQGGPPSFAGAERGGSGPPFDVRVDGGRLSVDLGAAVPLVRVLGAIAEQTGAELVVRGDPGEVRPQAFAGRPLAEGIRRLVEPNGLVLAFEPAPGPDAGPSRLSALVVQGPGAKPPVAAAPAPRPEPPVAAVPALLAALVRDDGADDYDAAAALASADPLERIGALRAIGYGAGDTALGPLVEALVGDEDAAVRRTAAAILADLGSEDALAALEAALVDPDGSVRAAAAEALDR